MNQKEIDRVLMHVEAGHKVLIASCYVDGFASVYEDANGEVVYSSQVWGENPLSELSFGKLFFYKEMKP